MKFKSALATQVSGSIGGFTASHNRGGMYLRSRAIPTDPASGLQTTRRLYFGIFSAYWAELSQANRDAWNLYGENVEVTDALGNAIKLSGQQWFVGSASVRARSGFSLVEAGPTTFSRPGLTPPALASADDTPELSITFEDSDDWANEDGGGLLIQVGRPQSPGVNFFKGPWRYADSIDGDDTTPPTSPAAIASPYALTIGQKVWVRVTCIMADGRYSQGVVLGPELVVANA